MIKTNFKNITDIFADTVTILMPYPVRVGEYIEIDGDTWEIYTASWIINTDPITSIRTVSLHVSIR